MLKKLYRCYQRFLIGKPSKRLYKFMITDWKRLTDLDVCSKVLESKRFNRNLQPLQMKHPNASRILVIAPHPDDDILGAGGTLINAKENGADIHILYVTNGNKTQADAIKKETLVVCEKLGVTPHFLNCSAREIPLDDPTVNRKFEHLFNELNPEAVFISFLLDDHDDHRRVNHLMRNIFKNRTVPNLEVWAYQIYSSIIPNVAVDITAHIERKKELIDIWRSVSRFNDLAHYMLGINAANCRYIIADNPVWVEVFFVVPFDEYLDLCDIYFENGNDTYYFYPN